ncbi:TadE/TadG family type IV pilus assembly protein [Streptomyces reticuliscabiei]|uniref:TadE/TadG family type IV pilus assembly protein n=1 Tax=Streptomyces reticuliscabiei TaxID=146821 RepID=UPI000A3AD080|nr:TadE/TadG family type IV pilus assembly protein [Streptomyces reticuliscabiei]
MTARQRPQRRGLRLGDDTGRVAVEFVLWVPAAIFVLMIAFAGGRIVTADQAVDAAAADAAREASIARDAGEAAANARAAAAATLSDQKLRCKSTRITVDTSGFSAPLGAYGAVTAKVTCTVNLADLGTGFGSKTVESEFTSVIDKYRQR